MFYLLIYLGWRSAQDCFFPSNTLLLLQYSPLLPPAFADASSQQLQSDHFPINLWSVVTCHINFFTAPNMAEGLFINRFTGQVHVSSRFFSIPWCKMTHGEQRTKKHNESSRCVLFTCNFQANPLTLLFNMPNIYDFQKRCTLFTR